MPAFWDVGIENGGFSKGWHTMRNAPEIRFKGFTDAWVQRKLREICKTTFGGGTPSTNNDEFWGGDVPWLQSSDISEHDVTNVKLRKHITEKGLENSAAKLVPAKSIAVVTRVGVGKISMVPFAYTTSQDFLSLSNIIIDIWFATYALYKKMQSELNSVQGTSIKGITKDELLNKTIAVPFSDKEQTAIGNFFRTLDDTIAIHKRKLDGLKELKKGYLQRMFPQTGESLPSVRFAGFNGQWEVRKLGEIAEFNPRSVLPNSFEYVDLESVIGTSLIFHRTENKNTAPSRAQRLAKRGDVFFQTVRPYQKNNYLFDLLFDNYVFSTGYAQLRPKIDNYFLFCKLQEENFITKVLDLCTGTSYPAINSTDLAEIKINIAMEKDEQTAIGNFFRNLDMQISDQQSKLEKLKQLKTAYLQKMFL
jgi:type I restriction enzyme S subunit